MLKKLPVGIQTFEKIINDDMLYIDKTHLALELIENEQYVFLSRPRRFGKSLFLDTLKELFEGNKKLFKGLFIEERYDWSKKYPVISVGFSGGIHNEDQFDLYVSSILQENEKRLGVSCQNRATPDLWFDELIARTAERYNEKVVILIDEYDKPILDNISEITNCIAIRSKLKDFYSRIKNNDRNIKFAMLTGVTKFSKISLFSGLNNLEDISLTTKYGDICGYTQDDIETTFKDYVRGVDLNKMKLWYNGYNFLGEKVYNPFDVLLFIKNNFTYRDYWIETGTPTFLIELIKSNNYYIPRFDDLVLESSFLNSFDIEDLNLETVMFQSGYLTIDEVIEKRGVLRYSLKFPNIEVKNSFVNTVLNLFTNKIDKIEVEDSICDALEISNFEFLEQALTKLFASIAYNNFTKNEIANYEGFYASIIYSYFSALGIELVAEDVTNKGRIDLTLKMGGKTYIFEFKVIDEDPLKQIKEKKYYEKYSGDVYIIGIVFNPKERNMSSFQWEIVTKEHNEN